MKILFFLFICFYNCLYSQYLPINLTSKKNYKKATVYFKDGTLKQGYVDYNSLAKNKVKFKEQATSKNKNYDSRKVKKLKFNADSTFYFYKKIANTRTFVLLKLVKEGKKMSLYTALNSLNQAIPFSENTRGLGIIVFNKEQKFYESLFFAKTNDDKAFYFRKNTRDEKFKKTVRNYFSDCPNFVDRVDNNQFNEEAIIDVIDFYNQECK